MKMKAIKYSVVAALATMCFSCSNDILGGAGNAEGNATITFSVEEPKQTRAGETIETSALDKKLDNIWLIQYVYDANGNEIEADRAVRYVTVSNNKISTTLRTTLTGETSKVYFIANTHDDELFDRLNPPAESVVKEYATPIDYTTIENGLPMSSTVSLSSFADGDNLSVKLQRRVAKVVINVSTNSNSTDAVELLDLQLQNTQTNVMMFSDDVKSSTSTASNNFDAVTWTNSTSNTYTYYIPASYAATNSAFPYLYIHGVTSDKFVTYRLRLQGEGDSSSDTWRTIENNHYYVLNANISGGKATGDEDSNVYIQSTNCKLVDNGDQAENCYTINSADNDNQYYRFPVKQINAYRNAFNVKPITADTTYHAKVIWWSAATSDATSSWVSVIGSTCHGNDGYVVIKRKDDNSDAIAGNALIGVFNDKEELLWSWHIWQRPETEDTEIDGSSFMALNLGATMVYPNVNRDLEMYNAIGLYYQWGRKDPFGSFYYGISTLNYPQNSYQLRLENYSDLGLSNAQTNIATARDLVVKNPTTFYYNTTADEDVNWPGCNGNASWGNGTKTVFDPCPYGYRVPTTAELAKLSNIGTVEGSNNYTIIKYSDNFVLPIGGWLTGNGVNGIGDLPGTNYTTYGGTYYSATSGTGQQNASYLLLNMAGNNTNANGSRTYARSIRPIKIKE